MRPTIKFNDTAGYAFIDLKCTVNIEKFKIKVVNKTTKLSVNQYLGDEMPALLPQD